MLNKLDRVTVMLNNCKFVLTKTKERFTVFKKLVNLPEVVTGQMMRVMLCVIYLKRK